jgi:dUTP pyrophosphatase
MKIGIKKLPNGADLPLPHYATPGSAGLDLLAAVDESIELLPGQWFAVPCGFAMELPHGVEAQVRPRSGLALKHGITCLNAPGTIDSDYRGEVKAILVNHGAEVFLIQRGHKIAQMVIARHEQPELVEVESLSDTARGAGGFGSTGMAPAQKADRP